jgi:hypothetical protein
MSSPSVSICCFINMAVNIVFKFRIVLIWLIITYEIISNHRWLLWTGTVSQKDNYV